MERTPFLPGYIQALKDQQNKLRAEIKPIYSWCWSDCLAALVVNYTIPTIKPCSITSAVQLLLELSFHPIKWPRCSSQRLNITFLFLCVQFGGHFLDSTQALKMAASLFRNTETQKRDWGNKMKLVQELFFQTEVKSQALRWAEPLCHSGCN